MVLFFIVRSIALSEHFTARTSDENRACLMGMFSYVFLLVYGKYISAHCSLRYKSLALQCMQSQSYFNRVVNPIHQNLHASASLLVLVMHTL